MNVGDPISNLARAVVHARIHALPSIRFQSAPCPPDTTNNECRKRVAAGTLPTITEEKRSSQENLDVYMFPQICDSTAPGFGDAGSASIRKTNTVVVVCDRCHTAAVYFAGQHAYNVDLTDEVNQNRLYGDIQDRMVASQADALWRYRQASPPEPGPEGSGSP